MTIESDFNSKKILQDINFEVAQKHLEEVAGSLRCPIHNKPPEFNISPSETGQFSVKVRACCEVFMKTVTDAL